ncbi:hypothetical protein [Yoonia sp. SDW83-1]|uniref:hypothetical protein n=1 Tax=Yoonia sp. SDW83-1 TaxID=3366945 RepID=UPI00398C3059
MNAHIAFKTQDQATQRKMVVRHMLNRQADLSWMDAVGACDDCSTVPFDATAAGRTRRLELDGDRLVMRDTSYGSILG